MAFGTGTGFAKVSFFPEHGFSEKKSSSWTMCIFGLFPQARKKWDILGKCRIIYYTLLLFGCPKSVVVKQVKRKENFFKKKTFGISFLSSLSDFL